MRPTRGLDSGDILAVQTVLWRLFGFSIATLGEEVLHGFCSSVPQYLRADFRPIPDATEWTPRIQQGQGGYQAHNWWSRDGLLGTPWI